MASAAVTSKKTKSPTANKNYSANLAKGGSVTVKDGVKTYSDKSLQVKGKGGISISGKDYSVNKGGSGFAPTTSVITADKMKPVPPIPLASPAPIDGMFGITNAANAGLAALNGGTYDTKTNQIVPPAAAPSAPADNNQAILNSYLQANAGLEAPSSVNNLKEMQKMLRPKENLVNSLSGQLNTLNASRDAEMLKLEGQGRGQTQGFIGGEQARINREAAIQAMPIQAQLAIAQDDLDSARTYASQYFQAKMQDETNIYNQKKENNRLIFDYLTSAEQRRLDANEKALDREYNEKQSTAKTAESIAMQAIEYGQSSLASKVMGLDPKSATYAQDVRNAMAGLRKPAPEKARTSDWEMEEVNGVSMWVNKFTQETKAVGDTSINGVDGPGGEMDKINLLRDTIDRIKGREADETTGKVAYDPLYKNASQTWTSQTFGRIFTGSSDLDNLKVYADTLKSNMLTLATDPEIKKFFGPQMSNADVQLMSASASRLQPENMKAEQLLSEVNRIEEFIGKYEAAVKAKQSGSVQNPNVVVGADGYEYEIVD